ncbi:hypothetical protein GCM10027258_92820 [Amycolatopsis stemonae]
MATRDAGWIGEPVDRHRLVTSAAEGGRGRRPGTFGALVEQLGVDVAQFGDLPVVLEPLPGGPRWRFAAAGLAGDPASQGAVVVRGGELATDAGDDVVSVDACVEQVNRARAIGDYSTAAEWAQRLTVLLVAKAAGPQPT